MTTKTLIAAALLALSAAPAAHASYGWPVKPFNTQHPLRAFLNDPRIGRNGGQAFHFGVDVAAPDGTPVYAVTAGTVFLSHGSLAVAAGPEHVFGYWHIRRAASLRHRQFVPRHALLGTIAPGWGHVHLAERIGGVYVNPLRAGGLEPYSDPTAPTVDGLRAVRHGTHYELVAEAHDTTWPPVPGPWRNEPVTPAVLRWRIGTGGAWHTAVDFRSRMLDRERFSSVYASGTAQNHEQRPGTYRFRLTTVRPGTYEVEVVATDIRGNRGSLTQTLRLGA